MIFSGQKISQLKQVMQCSRNLMTGKSLTLVSPGIPVSSGVSVIWMTSAGQTMSQMPQPVHRGKSMVSIMIENLTPCVHGVLSLFESFRKPKPHADLQAFDDFLGGAGKGHG